MFDHFTESARRMLFFARYEAGRAGAAAIEPDHLLFGLLRDPDTVAWRVLERHRLDVQRLHHEIESRGGNRTPLPLSAEMAFTAASKRTLELAREEAESTGPGHVGTEHVLLALLREPDSSAGRLLQEYGLRLDEVRRTVLRLGVEAGHPEPLGAPPTPGNWRGITDYVPSDQVHVEYSTAKPEHPPWRNVAGARWGAYGYTLGELAAIAWDAEVTVAPGVDATQRYDVQLVLRRVEEAEEIAARVRSAIESQLGVRVERGDDRRVTVRRRVPSS